MYPERDYEEYFSPPDPKPGDQGTCANCGHLITLVVIETKMNTLDWRHTTDKYCDNPELGGPA